MTKLKLFKTVKLNLAKCLYFPNQTHLFNTKRLLALFAVFMGVVSFCLYLNYEADRVIEYVRSAYMTITFVGIFISLLSTISKTEVIFILIDTNITKTIEESE